MPAPVLLRPGDEAVLSDAPDAVIWVVQSIHMHMRVRIKERGRPEYAEQEVDASCLKHPTLLQYQNAGDLI